MEWKAVAPDITDEKGKITFRRLIVAKQMYLHALQHSEMPGELDRMIAIHNFHNAIEITLKAIIIHNDICTDKKLDFKFSELITEIEKKFVGQGIKIHYKQELINMNLARNLAQHHASEPFRSGLDEARVYTREFLQEVFNDFFAINFDEVSQVDALVNDDLRTILKMAQDSFKNGDIERGLLITRFAFDLLIESCLEPESSEIHGVVNALIGEDQDDIIFHELASRIVNVEQRLFLVSRGIPLLEYDYFKNSTPSIYITSDGIGIYWDNQPTLQADASRVFDFVVSMAIQFQRAEDLFATSGNKADLIRRIIENNASDLCNAHKIDRSEIWKWVHAHMESTLYR